MNLDPSVENYLRSLSRELAAQANRVRDLIGSSHWLSDGHHKEYLLRALLRRHLPGSTTISRGFVVNPRELKRCSREQDLIVIDERFEAPFFSQGGLTIVPPASLMASISVKTSLGAAEFRDSLATLWSLRGVALSACVEPAELLLVGFFFETNAEPSEAVRRIRRWISTAGQTDSPNIPPSSTTIILCGLDDLYCELRWAADSDELELLGYDCEGCASGLFLATLASHVSSFMGAPRSEFSDMAEAAKVRPIR